MRPETKTCQNCKVDFVIEPEDFDFYTKIAVPPPTWCPGCRLLRRLSYYNLFTLYKRKCDLCGEYKMSRYSPDAPYTVYCPKCWWGDGWDGFEYGREYDFSRPFFEQFNELFKEAPLLALSLDIPATENSPFCNHAGELKDCYLLFDSGYVENGMIGFGVNKSTDILDSGPILECNNLYDCMHTYKSSNCVGTRSQVAECI